VAGLAAVVIGGLLVWFGIWFMFFWSPPSCHEGPLQCAANSFLRLVGRFVFGGLAVVVGVFLACVSVLGRGATAPASDHDE
jgi:hypothetical protein